MILLLGTACLAVAVSGAGYLAPQATRYLAMPQIHHRLRSSRSLVLTYDDGPGPSLTPAVLDLLKSHSARGTFFLLGRQVSNGSELLDRALREGHELGSHGFSHVNAWKSWPWKVRADIEQGYQSVARWVPPDGLFRPPYGKLSLPGWLALRRRGARLAWWTIDSGDTHAALPTPQSVADALARAGGGIVLLHDFDRSAPRMDFVLRTTELLLHTAKQEGINVSRYGELFCDGKRACDGASNPLKPGEL